MLEGFKIVFKEFFKEVFIFALGMGLEGPKGKGLKGWLFVLPFVIALVILIYLIVRIFIW